jgi:hypothetical protein
MKTLINAINSIVMKFWLIVAHFAIYTVQAAKTCLWVGTLGWVCLVYGISGSFNFSWTDLKYVAIIVLVLSAVMALIRMIGVIITVVRAHNLKVQGKTSDALEYEINRNVYNIWGFTFHHNTK